MIKTIQQNSGGLQRHTIHSVLRRKVDAIGSHIADEGVRKVFLENAIVTGGAIASMLLGEKVNDYDIYLRTGEAAETVARWFAARFDTRIGVLLEDDRVRLLIPAGVRPGTYPTRDSGMDAPELEAEIEDEVSKKNPTFKPTYLSENAITLDGGVQIVLRFFGPADTIHENFDFAHCTSYFQSWDNQLVLRPLAMECLLARKLKYVGSKYPLATLVRCRKFIQRGWKISAGELLKVALQLNGLDMTNPKVLGEQMVGVDSAYYARLIEEIGKRRPEGQKDEPMGMQWLLELIEEVL